MLTPDRCRIPPKATLDEADALGGNRHYIDLRGCTWSDVRAYLDLEAELLPILQRAANERNAINRFTYDRFFNSSGIDASISDPDGLAEAIEEYIFDHSPELDYGMLTVLDGGMTSIVAALSAVKCVPVYSCNGGAAAPRDDTRHNDSNPVVAFHANFRRCDLLNAAARHAGASLYHSGDLAVLEARDVETIREIARYLLSMRRRFVPGKRLAAVDKLAHSASQLKLF